ncbi:MAG: DinB family protein [Dehalococcoidia bacterium]
MTESTAVDPQFLRPMYRFNTWANEQIREAIAGADEALVRRPLDLWFGSAFAILVHLYAGEAIWLSRLRDGISPSRLLAEADLPSVAALVETWREIDVQWEAYVATLTAAALEEPVAWSSQFGDSFTHARWQILMHVPFHSSEHRAHAATALTALGIRHGPQDFHLQFMPPEAVALRMGR